MEILPDIAAQIDALRQPLHGVTLTALPRPDTPRLLLLRWHGFRPDMDYRGPGRGGIAG